MSKIEKLKNSDPKSLAKRFWAELLLIPIFFLALGLRYLPAQDMEYLQALDSYLIYKLSQNVAYTGHIPFLDFERYFPFAAPTYIEHQGSFTIPVIIYYMGPFLVFDSYLAYAQFYPALAGALSVAMMYFLAKELFDKITGLSAAFFLATITGVMHRSSAGFFQKDPTGMMMMVFSMYFFVRAYKRQQWISGILSGLFLGLFTITWGGSSVAWLLYGGFAGLVLLINEDTRSLIVSYTPTIIIAGIFASVVNSDRFWFDHRELFATSAVMLVLWSRYLIEEFEILEGQSLDYYVPTVYVVGTIMALLSPLYSQFIASNVFRLISEITRSGGSAIGGTVAENTPMTVQELSTQLGSVMASETHFILGIFSNIAGTWPLAYIGIALLGTLLTAMLLTKYNILEKPLHSDELLKIFAGVFTVWTIAFSIFFESPILVVAPSILLALAGSIAYYFWYDKEYQLENNWLYILPTFWVLATVIVATIQSRIIFLAAYPVALVAGFTLGMTIKSIYNFDIESIPDLELENTKAVKGFILGTIIGLVLVVNVAAGHAAVQEIGQSPEDPWIDSLEHINEETDPGSVQMSWWDYGYWFNAFAERPNVADGGNLDYYTSDSDQRMPFHLADFFTSTEPENHTEILEKHSVDHILLDNTMIGKYSAVSQIANRDNEEYDSMLQTFTPSSFENSLTETGENEYSAEFVDFRSGLRVYANLRASETEQGSFDFEFSDTATLEAGGRADINCALTDEGIVSLSNETGIGQGSGFCIAEDPYYSFDRALATGGQASVVLVPEDIVDHTIVRLYLMDGHDIDFVEKDEEASNDYIKVWEVDEDL